MKMLTILWLSLSWLNTLEALEAWQCWYLQEKCRCLDKDEKLSVTCDQSYLELGGSSHSVSAYLSEWATEFQYIKIANKKWTHISWDDEFSFYDISRIENLTLNFNSIQSVDPEFFSIGFYSLYQLDVSFNSLTNCFELNTPNLIYISLVGNQIENLDETCFRGLDKLQTIRLEGNKIMNLDWRLDRLPGLRGLILSYNSVSSMRVKNLENLELLKLWSTSVKISNKLDLRGLDNLKYLEINLNGYMEFPYIYGVVNLERLDLADQFISSIDAEALKLLPQLGSFSLRNNLVKKIKNFCFNHSTKLEWLDLSNNQIETVESDGFQGLISLMTLNLTYNKLQRVPAQAFLPLTKLYHLNLNKNSLSVLDSKNFVHLQKSLLVLNISYNKINYVKRDWLFGLFRLTRLNLSFNSISSIESGSLDSLVSLTDLDLSNNCLFKIGPNLFNTLSSLTTLLLNENLLASINRRAFASQTNLTRLDMQNNQLWTRLPTSLFHNLSKLEYLNLGGNNLSKMNTKQFEGLNSLRGLNLNGNYLSSLNNSLDQIESLQELYLSGNNINVGPGSSNSMMISKSVMNKLSKLSVSNNDIDLELLFTEYDLDNLEELDLSSMNLNRSIKALQRLKVKSLKILDISDNDFGDTNVIGMINQNISWLEVLVLSNVNAVSSHLNFTNLVNLTYLDLSSNMITEIYNWTFRNNTDLEYLYLSDNNISFIEKDSLNDLVYLIAIDLSWNKLKTLSETGIRIRNYVLLSEFKINHNLLEYNKYNLTGSSEVDSIDFSTNKIKGFGLNPGIIYVELVSLNLSKNLIESFEGEAFKTGIGLIELDLSHNLLKEIPSELFKYLSRLEELYLNNNQLTDLSNDVFKNLTCMKELRLQNNGIKILQPTHFIDLRLLNRLEVSLNNLSLINDNVFMELNQLAVLDISENPNLDNYTNLTFSGLSNVRLITLDRLNQNNFEIVKQAFKAPFVKKTLNVNYFRSIDITYGDDNQNLTESDCKHTLELIRVNLKLNLETSDNFDLFLATCQTVFHSLLEKLTN